MAGNGIHQDLNQSGGAAVAGPTGDVKIVKPDGSETYYADFSAAAAAWVADDVVEILADYTETTTSPNYDIPNGVIINGNGHKFSSAVSATGSGNGVFRVQSGDTAYIYNLEFNCGWATSTGAFFNVLSGGKLISDKTLLFTADDSTANGTHGLLVVDSGGFASGIRMVIDTPTINNNQCLKVNGVLFDSYFEQKQTNYTLLAGSGNFVSCKSNNVKLSGTGVHTDCEYLYTSTSTGTDTMLTNDSQTYYNCVIKGDFPTATNVRIGSYQSGNKVVKMYDCYVSLTATATNAYLFNRVNTGTAPEKSVFQNCDLISNKNGFIYIDETRILDCNLITDGVCIDSGSDTGEVIGGYMYSETSHNIQASTTGSERGTLIGVKFEVGDPTKNNLNGSLTAWYNFKQCTFLGANNPLSTADLITANIFRTAEAIDSLGNTGLGFYGSDVRATTAERTGTIQSSLGTANAGFIVYDTDLGYRLEWTGTAWSTFSGEKPQWTRTYGSSGSVSTLTMMNGNFNEFDNGHAFGTGVKIRGLVLNAFTHEAIAADTVTIEVYSRADDQGAARTAGTGTLLLSQAMKVYGGLTAVTYDLISEVILGSEVSIPADEKVFVDIKFATGFATLGSPNVELLLTK